MTTEAFVLYKFPSREEVIKHLLKGLAISHNWKEMASIIQKVKPNIPYIGGVFAEMLLHYECPVDVMLTHISGENELFIRNGTDVKAIKNAIDSIWKRRHEEDFNSLVIDTISDETMSIEINKDDRHKAYEDMFLYGSPDMKEYFEEWGKPLFG